MINEVDEGLARTKTNEADISTQQADVREGRNSLTCSAALVGLIDFLVLFVLNIFYR